MATKVTTSTMRTRTGEIVKVTKKKSTKFFVVKKY